MAEKVENVTIRASMPNLMTDYHYQILAMRGAGDTPAVIANRLRVTEAFVDRHLYEVFQLCLTKQGVALVQSMAVAFERRLRETTFDIEGILIFEAVSDVGQPRRRRTDNMGG